MTSINRLNIKPSLDDADLFPIWDSDAGRTRAATAETMANFVKDNIPSGSLTGRVIVTSASQLSGSLLSTKEYFIDGSVDMGNQSITVPVGGLHLAGYDFELSNLYSSAAGYTMFISPAGGSGSLFIRDMAISTSGAGSQVFDVTGNTGNEAFELSRVYFNNCDSLGEISVYRQGLETGTGRFGGKPSLTLSGAWSGGYFIDTSIVRNLTDGAYALYSAGAGFVMQSRFRSNHNIDLPASASFFDFSDANFPNPSTVQIIGDIVTRNGAFDSSDPNITPNMTSGSLSAAWSNNIGMPNTFEGGAVGVTTEAATVISQIGVFVEANAAAWTSSDLQHFDNPSAGRLRHLGNNPRDYAVTANFSVTSAANDEITLRVVRWDASMSQFFTVLNQSRQVNNLIGGRDVAFFNVSINTVLDQNDYVAIQFANGTSTADITAEVDSYIIVEAR